MPSATWEEMIKSAFDADIDLQVHGYSNTADAQYYNVCGVCFAEVEVDILTGEHEIIRVDLIEDPGRSISPEIDIGQVEGAFIMGVGYWTSEHIVFDPQNGEILTDRTWTYHVPQARDIPQDFQIYLTKKYPSSDAILGMKAIGEPPLCLSVVIPFAMREAIVSARLESGLPANKWFAIVGSNVNANTSLLDFIRGRAGLKGTKYMCKEGGCGACIVAVVRKNSTIMAVNSCMVSVLSCLNWEITTIEEIGNRKKGYHPIQTTLAAYSGSQCGHCSPGWVMAMYSLKESKKSLDMLEIEKSFASNVCRCTGYRPILEAFKTFASDAPKPQDIDIEDLGICQKLQSVCNLRVCHIDEWYIITEKEVEAQTKKIILNDGSIWFRVEELNEIFDVFNTQGITDYMLVAGNTAKGAYPIQRYPRILIDISELPELKTYIVDQNLFIGAGTTLSELKNIWEKVSQQDYFGYLNILNNHLKLVANISIKNLGTVGGNLMIKHQYNDFPSDIFVLLETVGARLTIVFNMTERNTVTMQQFLRLDMTGKIILNVIMPPLNDDFKVVTYKVMPKAQNAHAIVNAGFLYKYNSKDNVVRSARIVYGGLSPIFIRAGGTEKFLVNKNLFQNMTLQSAIGILEKELVVFEKPPQLPALYRKSLALSLFYKSLLSLCPTFKISSQYRSAVIRLNESRPLSVGQQIYTTNPSLYPLNQPLPKIEALAQCSGEAIYTDDELEFPNEVHAAFVLSTVPKGRIDTIDASAALNKPGVIAFYTANDIPGLNSFTVIEDPTDSANEEVFSSGIINYFNQPIGVIVAETQVKANEAAKMVIVRYIDISKPVTDLIQAKLDPNRIQLYKSISAQNKGTDITKVINGSSTIRGQYHFTLETHVCITRPSEDGFEVYSSSQWADAVQLMISRALSIEQNRIYVQVRRVGGGYGVKVSRSTQVAVACCLVSQKLNRPCRFVTPLTVNTKAFGKRFPNNADYTVAVNTEGKIQYLNLNLYEDNGYMINELLVMLAYPNFNNCYDSSCWNYNIYNITTDTAKNTWCRAPGSLESISMCEIIMERISYELNLDPIEVRLVNLDPLTAINNIEMLNDLKVKSDYDIRKTEVLTFNYDNKWKKRGLRFSFMRYKNNDPRYYDFNIAVYHGDGSVTITPGGVEIGQGVNTKAAQLCAHLLNIPLNKVNVAIMNTRTAPNSSVTAGSVTTQFTSIGISKCCKELLNRLQPVMKVLPNGSWEEIIRKAYEMNIDLQVHGFVNDENVINYFVYGVALSEVEVDILTGEYEVVRVDILQDVGQSINPDLDVGQVEGAFTMGLGYWTSENLVYDNCTGELLTDRTWNYYVPQARDIPQDFRIYFRNNSYSPPQIFGAKGSNILFYNFCVKSLYHCLAKIISIQCI
ncbi:unnamed protein product [Diatraea saccharalis]|uniref:Uncharacterized protein n=1 Tax=Diatraea saccharalis TaxID=40085 RepID=A0A9P0C5L2_9NEOP|nr:unnamed protein product [Diatraea saccharalis]